MQTMTAANFNSPEPDVVSSIGNAPLFVGARGLDRPIRRKRSPWIILAPIVVVSAFAAGAYAIMAHEGALGAKPTAAPPAKIAQAAPPLPLAAPAVPAAPAVIPTAPSKVAEPSRPRLATNASAARRPRATQSAAPSAESSGVNANGAVPIEPAPVPSQPRTSATAPTVANPAPLTVPPVTPIVPSAAPTLTPPSQPATATPQS
jgi:hypothetical protein